MDKFLQPKENQGLCITAFLPEVFLKAFLTRVQLPISRDNVKYGLFEIKIQPFLCCENQTQSMNLFITILQTLGRSHFLLTSWPAAVHSEPI